MSTKDDRSRPAPFVSPYLLRPLRTYEEYLRERTERSKQARQREGTPSKDDRAAAGDASDPWPASGGRDR